MEKKINICQYLELNKNKKRFKIYLKKTKFSWHLDKDTVLLKNFFSSINYRDYLASKGSLAVARRFPYVPGVDLVGKVIESSNKNFLKGDRVAAFSIPNNNAYPGAWSNYCKIHSRNLFKIPKKWKFEDVISIGTAGLAAASGINSILLNSKINKKNKFSLLVTGASGGVGSVACLFGKMFGWKITAVTRNVKKNKRYLKSLGVQKIIGSKNFLLDSKMNLLPPEYDAIMECLGGKYLWNSIKKLKKNGVCALSGLIAGQDLSGVSVLPFLMRGIVLVGTGAEILDQKRKKNSLKLIGKLIETGQLKKIQKKINFGQVSNKLKDWPNNNNTGRLIIKI
jgi:acrylyl-CoA reductase (NADPH)